MPEKDEIISEAPFNGGESDVSEAGGIPSRKAALKRKKKETIKEEEDATATEKPKRKYTRKNKIEVESSSEGDEEQKSKSNIDLLNQSIRMIASVLKETSSFIKSSHSKVSAIESNITSAALASKQVKSDMKTIESRAKRTAGFISDALDNSKKTKNASRTVYNRTSGNGSVAANTIHIMAAKLHITGGNGSRLGRPPKVHPMARKMSLAGGMVKPKRVSPIVTNSVQSDKEDKIWKSKIISLLSIIANNSTSKSKNIGDSRSNSSEGGGSKGLLALLGGTALLANFGSFSDIAKKLGGVGKKIGSMAYDFVEKVSPFVKSTVKVLGLLGKLIGDVVFILTEPMKKAYQSLKPVFLNIADMFIKFNKKLIEFVPKIFQSFAWVGKKIGSAAFIVVDSLNSFGKFLGSGIFTIVEGIKNFGNAITSGALSLIQSATDLGIKFGDAIAAGIAIIQAPFDKMAAIITSIVEGFIGIGKKLGFGIVDTIKGTNQNLKEKAIVAKEEKKNTESTRMAKAISSAMPSSVLNTSPENKDYSPKTSTVGLGDYGVLGNTKNDSSDIIANTSRGNTPKSDPVVSFPYVESKVPALTPMNITKSLVSPTTMKLESVNNEAKEIEQKKASESSKPIIIDNSTSTHNSSGGSKQPSNPNIRIHTRNNEPTKQFLDRLTISSSYMGTGYVLT